MAAGGGEGHDRTGHPTRRPRTIAAVIYHLALREEWDEAVVAGQYRRSTLGVTLAEQGFIHCSYDHQVQTIADLVYRDRRDVVLLDIDERLVPAEIRDEDEFPHIYGALPVDAVVHVRPLSVEEDGRLAVPSL